MGVVIAFVGGIVGTAGARDGDVCVWRRRSLREAKRSHALRNRLADEVIPEGQEGQVAIEKRTQRVVR